MSPSEVDYPRWQRGLERLQRASLTVSEGKRRGGVIGTMRRGLGMAQGAAAFASIYTIPVIRHELPESSRMEPAY